MTVSVSKPAPITAQGTPLLSARKQLDIVTACREVGTYRGAAEMGGVTHKTVSRVVNQAKAAERRTARRRNYESSASLNESVKACPASACSASYPDTAAPITSASSAVVVMPNTTPTAAATRVPVRRSPEGWCGCAHDRHS